MYVTRRTIKLCYFDYYQEGCWKDAIYTNLTQNIAKCDTNSTLASTSILYLAAMFVEEVLYLCLRQSFEVT